MNIQKALFFKPGAIGDLLHALPVLKAFRKTFPSAHVTLVVSPPMKSVIEGPVIADCVLVFDKTQFKKNAWALVRFGLMLRNEQYDLFVDLQPSLRSRFIRLLAGAAKTLVYKKQKRIAEGIRRLHAVENFAETLKPIGVSHIDPEIDLPIPRTAVEAATGFLRKNGYAGPGILIALNCSVGAARPARNWFPERFSLLADRLIQELSAKIVFIGGAEDRDLVRRVMDAMQQRAVSSAGDLSIAESAALLARCSCLVSSDTGPLHLATAVHTPVIGLYGSTDPLRTGPFGEGHTVIDKQLSCVPCEEKECPEGTRACMDAISVNEVFEAVRKTIA
jgi:lipopolysaccharide heptosyltransferase II